jgi:hypothetical protein
MMILIRAYYELFEGEAEWLDSNPSSEVVELDRQLRLETSNGACLFISWNWRPGSDIYFVDMSPTSFCMDPGVVRDVSELLLWRPLIGNTIVIDYLDADKQVLRLQTGNETLYCCSFSRGMWAMDALTIARNLPKPLPV